MAVPRDGREPVKRASQRGDRSLDQGTKSHRRPMLKGSRGSQIIAQKAIDGGSKVRGQFQGQSAIRGWWVSEAGWNRNDSAGSEYGTKADGERYPKDGHHP